MKMIEINTAKEFASTFFGDPILKMAVNAAIDNAPTVDAVPVDKIIFHHILIDENGIPEVKLRFGERMLTLRKTDPVHVVEVVRCADCVYCERELGSLWCQKSWNQFDTSPAYNKVSEEDYCSRGERRTDNETDNP